MKRRRVGTDSRVGSSLVLAVSWVRQRRIALHPGEVYSIGLLAEEDLELAAPIGIWLQQAGACPAQLKIATGLCSGWIMSQGRKETV